MLLQDQCLWEPEKVKSKTLRLLAYNCQANSKKNFGLVKNMQEDSALYTAAVYQRAFFQLWHMHERMLGKVRYNCNNCTHLHFENFAFFLIFLCTRLQRFLKFYRYLLQNLMQWKFMIRCRPASPSE